MNFLTKIMAEPEETYPLPSKLFHDEKKRKDSIKKMQSLNEPLFLLIYPDEKIDQFTTSPEASELAKITDHGWIYDKTESDKITNKLKKLGIKYKSFELPEEYQKQADIFKPEDFPSEVKEEMKQVQKNWSDIQKQQGIVPDEVEKETEDKELDIEKTNIDKIKEIPKPILLIVDLGESQEKKDYTTKALNSKKNKDIFDKLEILTTLENRYVAGVASSSEIKAIKSLLNRETIDFAESLKSIPLGETPFTDLDITFKSLDLSDEDQTSMRNTLNKIWSKTADEEDVEEDDEDLFGEKVKKGIPPDAFRKIKKIIKPYLLLIKSKENTSEYAKFIKEKEVTSLLTKGVKYIITRKERIHSWLIPESIVKSIQEQAKKHNVLWSTGIMPKDLNEKDQPFADVKIMTGTFGKFNETSLKNELNSNWVVSEQSVVKKPVLEINSLVPLDYMRFLSPQQREVELYLGGHPVDVGMLGIAYILLETEEEGEKGKEILIKLQLPEKIYEDMDVVSYLPKGFTGISPKKITPSNCLILHAKETFEIKPQAKDSDKEKRKEDIHKKLFNEIKKISGDKLDENAIDSLIERKVKEKGEAIKDEFAGVGLADADEAAFDKKIDEIFKKYDEDIYNYIHNTEEVTQLDILHLIAKKYLNSDIKSAGSFVNTNKFIGTHVAHFSRDMTICMLWGTIKPGKVNKEEILGQYPFIKEIDDTFL